MRSGDRRGLGTYALEAAIAAVHADAARAEDTDWPQIVGLYDELYAVHPTPVIALNQAVARSMCDGPAVALTIVDELRPSLESYAPWHIARADLLRRLGRPSEAAACYRAAHALTDNEAQRRFLERRLAELSG